MGCTRQDKARVIASTSGGASLPSPPPLYHWPSPYLLSVALAHPAIFTQTSNPQPFHSSSPLHVDDEIATSDRREGMYCCQAYNKANWDGRRGGWMVYRGCWSLISFNFDYYLAQKWDLGGCCKKQDRSANFLSHLMAMITRAGTETITPTLLINKLTLWSITQ